MQPASPKVLQREIAARVPRGSLDQNLFRATVWLWRHRGHSFDESVARARQYIRRRAPDFEPRLRPADQASGRR